MIEIPDRVRKPALLVVDMQNDFVRVGAALEVADHGYVLETGAFALDGPASALAHDPRVIETYLGAARKPG